MPGPIFTATQNVRILSDRRAWGLIGGSSYDPVAQAIIDAIEATDAGAQTDPVRRAIDTYVRAEQAADTWAKNVAFYGYVGATANSHAINWKAPGTFNKTWGGTVTHNANGITGNGSTGFGNTGVVPSAELALASAAQFFYSRNTGTVDAYICGAITGGDAFTFYGPDGGGTVYCDFWNTGTGRATAVTSGPQGLLTASRVSLTDMKYYQGATELASQTADATGQARPTHACYVLGANSSGSLSFPSSGNLAAYGISSGLTAADVAARSAAMTALQTALGRNV